MYRMPHYNVFIQHVHNNTRKTNNFLKNNNRYRLTRKRKKKKVAGQCMGIKSELEKKTLTALA